MVISSYEKLKYFNSSLRQLGIWVFNQRQYYERFIKDRRSPLTLKKVEILNELGFVWTNQSSEIVNNDSSAEGNHIHMLDDALACHILSFLLNIKDISSFSSTSRYYYNILHETQSQHSNILFTQLYSHKYSNERSMNVSEWNSSSSSSMLDAWRDMSKLEMAVKLQTDLDEEVIAFAKDNVQSYLRTDDGIGILSQRKECQAILRDNASLVPPNDVKKYNIGFGGMVRFTVQHSLLNGDVGSNKNCSDTKEHIAIWGDFKGIRVCNSVNDLLSQQGRDVFHSVGRARFGRVSTAIPAPSLRQESKKTHPRRPCLYLGCLSGAVIGLFPVPGDGNVLDCDYGMSAMTFAHSKSVTALSVLHVPMSFATGGGEFLLSAGRDGKVQLYPNSFSARHQFEIHSRVLCCENKTPISTLTSSSSESSVFIFTGDEGGRIIIWKSRAGSTLRYSHDAEIDVTR